MKLTKAQVDKILEEVSQDLVELIKSEELSKADPGAQALGEGAPEGSSVATPPAAPEGSEDKSPEESSSAESPESPAPEGSEGSDPAQEESISPEQLQAEYSKLPVEELQAHFLACKQALMAVMGGEGSQPPAPEATAPAAPPVSPSAPPVSPSATPAAPAAPAPEATDPLSVNKSEVSEGEQLKKAEVESLKKSLEDQGKLVAEQALALDRLSNAFLKIANMPLRKSAESVDHVGKPTVEVTLSKSEAIKKLNTVSLKSDLKKSDRQLINQYALGHVGLDAVAHLLRD
jgi:hypothetical protein